MRIRPSLHVVYWLRPGSPGLFSWGQTWREVVDVLHFHTPDDEVRSRTEELNRQVSNLRSPQGGFERDPRRNLPGAFRAIHLDPGEDPTLFVIARRPGGRRLPLVGPAAILEKEIALLRLAPYPLSVERYSVASDPFERRYKEPPSEARGSSAATHALAGLRAGSPPSSVIVGLGVPELLWLASAAQDARMSTAFRVIAEGALAKERTTSTFNVCGSAYREMTPSRSREMYEASLDLVPSPEHNPYAHIGLAATLRRLDESDLAYLHVAKALHFYPQNEYGLRVKNAILKERHGVRVRRVPVPVEA
jgi:hypothetical protein